MELPEYVRRPLEEAGAAGLYVEHVCIGYVAPTSVAWFAALDHAGQIVDAVARVLGEAEYLAWAARLRDEATRRRARLAVFELTDEQLSAAMAARARLN